MKPKWNETKTNKSKQKFRMTLLLFFMEHSSYRFVHRTSCMMVNVEFCEYKLNAEYRMFNIIIEFAQSESSPAWTFYRSISFCRFFFFFLVLLASSFPDGVRFDIQIQESTSEILCLAIEMPEMPEMPECNLNGI